MRRNGMRLTCLAGALAAALLLAGCAPVVAPAAASSVAEECDQGLWQHVYRPPRLIVLRSCVTITGTVEGVERDPDGDFHVRVRPDAEFASMVNGWNRIAQRGDLVVEVICAHPPRTRVARAACEGYTNAVPIPTVGERVRVTGPFVQDTVFLGHFGWTEIHPANSIEPIQ